MNLDTNVPILLLPLKIETRYVSDELWIRVFPDEVFLQTHDPLLDPEEKKDALHFKTLSALEDQKKAWHKLVSKYGAYRAAWIVQISPTELASQGKALPEEDKTHYFRRLPDRLYFYIYTKDGNKLKLYKKAGHVPKGEIIPREGLPALGDDDEWINNFEEAVKKGMGIKIKPFTEPKVERIIVTGFREGENHAEEVSALFKGHQYSKGFSFVEYGTPTNNFEGERSPHSISDRFEMEKSFEYSVNSPSLNGRRNAAGYRFAQALGLDENAFKNTKNAANEESSLAANFQKASWFAMGGQTLDLLLGDQISNKIRRELWFHYYKYVKAKGPLPSVKIGKQPYGVLPVMSLHDDKLRTNPLEPIFAQLYPIFRALFDKWLTMVDNNVPRIDTYDFEKDPYEEILKVLSMQEYSVAYQVRARRYDRISSRIPGWLQNKKNIPTPLPTLPLGQLYDLLQGRPEVAHMIDSINVNDQKLNFLKEYIPDKERLRYAPVLAFKDKIEGKVGAYALSEETVNDPEAEAKINLRLTQDSFAALQEVVHQIKKPVGSGSAPRTEILNYGAEQLSLFVDLFLRGYAGAARLHYQIVYFQPSNAQLQQFKSFRVKSPGGKLNDGVILTDGTKELKIESPIEMKYPFPGKIVEWFVDENTEVKAGQKLFLVKDKNRLEFFNNDFAKLGQAIIDEIATLSEEDKKAAQKEAIREAIDLNSYRLDAWITSLAARRLDYVRTDLSFFAVKNKIHLGAYGWLENLQKNASTVDRGTLTDTLTRSDGGIIHCPSPAQALAATVFKNSFLTHQNEEGRSAPNPFTLNLFSDRIQKSGRFMEGVRQGQSVEALLGYRLERYLHEKKMHEEIYTLRRAFPLEVNIVNRGNDDTDVGFKQLSVVDGLKIMEAYKNNGLPASITGTNLTKLKDGIAQLEDVFDGSLDSLFYEAGYQLLQGGLDRSAAAMDAAMGKIDPPEIESLKTRIPGTGMNHKLALVFGPPSNFGVEKAKAYLEPRLETWLQSQLADMKKIGCKVALYEGDEVYKENGRALPYQTVDVKLHELNLTYLDLFYLSETPVSDGAGELELRIWKHVESTSHPRKNTTFKITAEAPHGCKPLAEALEWAQYALAFLSRSRFLKSEDLKMTGEESVYDKAALKNIRKRIADLTHFANARRTNPITHLKLLSLFDFQEAKNAFLTLSRPDLLKLTEEIDNKVNQVKDYLKDFDQMIADPAVYYYRAFEPLSKAAKVLFGPAFILLPPASASPKYPQVLDASGQKKLIGSPDLNLNMTSGQERVQLWVEELAQVKAGAAAFEEWQMVNAAWNNDKADTGYYYQIVQSPTGAAYPWVALSKAEIKELKQRFRYLNLGEGRDYPQGAESIAFYALTNLTFKTPVKNTWISIPQYGIVIEEFSEHVPDEETTTGLSFHYNGPNSEAPQSLLLAVQGERSTDRNLWTPDDLADILNDTLDLAKTRLVDLEAMEDFGFMLPMVNWFDIPPVN